jgi:hypothetical protein
MDSVCPSSIYTGSSSPFVNTVGTTTTLLKDRDTTNPTLLPVPSFSSSLKTTKTRISLTASKSYDVSPFSVTSIVQEANTTLGSRYIPLSGTLNAPVSKLTSSQLENTYAAFTSKNIPGASPTRLMIIPGSTLQARNLTGNVTDAIESVSYDLMYSLQYEFCFYTKYFSILLADYIFIQNKQTDTNGFSEARKNALIQTIVNNLTVVKARLTDITDVAATIGTKQTGELKGMNDSINAFVQSTKASVDTLNANASILMSKDKESNLRSRQLSYSEEKNAYANQLLAMYGFANLIALGLLFYIYKS